MTGRALRLEDRGVKHSNLKTGAPNEREAHQPATPTHARRHERAQVRARYATRVHPCRQEARDFPRPFPRHATPEELRAFQLHMTENSAQPPSINATVTALRFFFKVTLDRPETTRHLVFVYEPRKLPRVLSPEEVLRLLEAAPGPKHKAALSVAYGAGLRAMEVVALKICDIDSKRMMLRVDQGKGRKDRHAMLSPQLLELLRDWWRIAHPQVWMFPGRDRVNPMTTRQLNRVCHMAAELAGLPTWVAPHTLRHSFATHLLEQKIDIRVIQVLLGHSKLDTTVRYTQVATNIIREVMSPLDRLTPLVPKKDEIGRAS